MTTPQEKLRNIWISELFWEWGWGRCEGEGKSPRFQLQEKPPEDRNTNIGMYVKLYQTASIAWL